MVDWVQAWWQVQQSWSFLRHAYRNRWGMPNDVAEAWMHHSNRHNSDMRQSYAMAYAVSHVASTTGI